MAPMAEQKRRLLTPDEVAEQLGVPPRTAADLIRAGKIPSLKVGRYRRIDPDDLEKYIEESKQRKEQQ